MHFSISQIHQTLQISTEGQSIPVRTNHLLSKTCMVKIFLAEAQTFIRSALKAMTEKNLGAVVTEAANAASLNQQLAASDYDIFVVDADMPGLNIPIVIAEILALKKNNRILILGTKPEIPYTKMYLQLGAKAYLLKIAPKDTFIKACKALLAGNRFVNEAAEHELVKDALTGLSHLPFENLSPREKEILLQLLKGSTINAIGDDLGLSPSTISTFKARILEKLKTKNMMEIRAMAMAYGVISDGPAAI